jgi:hypothetical protein
VRICEIYSVEIEKRNNEIGAKERLNETRYAVPVLLMTQLGEGSSDYTLKGSFASVTHSFFALSHPRPLYNAR